MYATLKAKWIEIKNCETFTRTYNLGGEKKITYIDRIVIDWKHKTIYDTTQEADAKVYDDNDWIELMINRVRGPYTTEASVKTAKSKLKNELRKQN